MRLFRRFIYYKKRSGDYLCVMMTIQRFLDKCQLSGPLLQCEAAPYRDNALQLRHFSQLYCDRDGGI